jgi:hypothetical protein
VTNLIIFISKNGEKVMKDHNKNHNIFNFFSFHILKKRNGKEHHEWMVGQVK